jgi:hypothetical protein
LRSDIGVRKLRSVFGLGHGRGNVFRMSSLVRVSAVAGALLLAGCAGSTPSWDWIPSMSSASNVSLTIESDPPGADAKTSLGASCRTPCMIPVAADREFTVTYSLNGYQPQVVAVAPRSAVSQVDVAGSIDGGTAAQSVDLAPNPVYAQLQPAPPPPQSRKGRGRAPKRQ